MREAEANADSAEIARLQDELDRRDGELARQRAELERVGDEMRVYEDEFARLHDQTEQSREMGAVELAALRKEVAHQKRETARAKAQLDHAKAQLLGAEAQLEARQAELDATRDALDVARADFTRRIEAARAEANDAEVARLTAELKAREAELAGQAATVSQLELQVGDLQDETAVLVEALGEIGPAAGGAPQELANAAPVIEMIDPPLPVTRGGAPNVQTRSAGIDRVIIGKITAPVGLMALTVNDRAASVDENGLFQAPVAVGTGPTPVTIVAIDKQGLRTALDFVLTPPEVVQTAKKAEEPAPTEAIDPELFGDYYALVIGNNDYTNMRKLNTAVNDAEHVAEVLRTKYGFETKLLTNATRYDILKALAELRKELTEDDNLLVYYAGHGELDRINQRGFWLPVDADTDITANWISNIDVTDQLNVMSAKHVLVVADSCYSGAMTRASLAKIEGGMSEKARTKWLEVMSEQRSRTVLTSGGLEPVLDAGGGQNHSVFAEAFLSVLNDNAAILEGQNLYRAVAERIAGAEVDQVPEYAPIKFAGHEAGDFLFVPRPI